MVIERVAIDRPIGRSQSSVTEAGHPGRDNTLYRCVRRPGGSQQSRHVVRALDRLSVRRQREGRHADAAGRV